MCTQERNSGALPPTSQDMANPPTQLHFHPIFLKEITMEGNKVDDTNACIKRSQETELLPDNFYLKGKEIQNRSGPNINSASTQDCQFQEFLGWASLLPF